MLYSMMLHNLELVSCADCCSVEKFVSTTGNIGSAVPLSAAKYYIAVCDCEGGWDQRISARLHHKVSIHLQIHHRQIIWSASPTSEILHKVWPQNLPCASRCLFCHTFSFSLRFFSFWFIFLHTILKL